MSYLSNNFGFLWGLLLVPLALLCGCSSPSAVSRPPETIANIPQPQTVSSPQLPYVSVEDYLSRMEERGMLRAWRRVENRDRYRVARADDFRIPEWTRNERYRIDIDNALERVSDSGDINRDWYPFDFALIVVDATKVEPARFGIVIFNERAGKTYEAFWLYRNIDLSRHTIGRNSGGIYVNEFREDGAYTNCRVRCNRRTREYTCGEW